MKPLTQKIIIYAIITIIVVALEIYIWQLSHPGTGITTPPVSSTATQK